MNKKDLRIVYLGTPDISAIVLEHLLSAGYNIVAVVSQEDKPVGRKQIIMPTPVKEVALKHNIPVFQPKKIRLDFNFLYEFKPDILLTMAYGQIIPHAVLEIPTIKALNLHGSLLPKYRGASPIQASLFNGDKQTGVTLMEMVDEMDAGNMFYKTVINIDQNDNYDTLKTKIALSAVTCFDEGIEKIINEHYNGEVQDLSQVSFTKKIKAEDQLLNFNESTESIVNKIRALTSDPGAYFIYKNEKIKVQKASVESFKNGLIPGKIFNYNKSGLYIETSDGVIRIEILQKPGKKSTAIKDFYNGNQSFFNIGEIINAGN